MQGAPSPNSPPSRGRRRDGKRGQRGHGGEQKEASDRRSGIKGAISLEIYTTAMSWEAGRFLGYDPLPVCLLPTLVSAGRIIKDWLNLPASIAAMRRKHSAASGSLLNFSCVASPFSDHIKLVLVLVLVLVTVLSAQHVSEPTTNFFFFFHARL